MTLDLLEVKKKKTIRGETNAGDSWCDFHNLSENVKYLELTTESLQEFFERKIERKREGGREGEI